MTTAQEWDVVSSVGLTALAVAAGRSIDTHRHDGLVRDPYAEDFVNAAQPPIPMLTRPPEPDSDADEITQLWTHVADHMGVRSRFFDRYFQRACEAGARQAVILASGLDTRCFRLDWPTDFSLFEIDQPKVLEFKDTVLDDAQANSTCQRHVVPIDLREDWAHGLLQAGFDPTLPTAWLAEGLLPYLPAEAEEQLLSTIHELSAPGSHIALEHIQSFQALLDEPTFVRVSKQFGVDIRELLHEDERPDPDIQLASRGWTVAIDSADEVARHYEREPAAMSGQLTDLCRFVTAHLPR